MIRDRLQMLTSEVEKVCELRTLSFDLKASVLAYYNREIKAERVRLGLEKAEDSDNADD